MDPDCSCIACRSRRWLVDWAEGVEDTRPDDDVIRREVVRLMAENAAARQRAADMASLASQKIVVRRQ